MLFIDRFEKKFLFSLTRLVALFFISLALLGLLGGVLASLMALAPVKTDLSPAEIAAIATPEEPATSTGDEDAATNATAELEKEPDALSGIKLPFIVQKHFSDPDNMNTLRNWIKTLPFEEKNRFIDEMAQVIKMAEDNKTDAMTAINQYNALKQQKFYEKAIAQAQSDEDQMKLLGIIGVTIITIALFSLVLVLLAIERNTRKADA